MSNTEENLNDFDETVEETINKHEDTPEGRKAFANKVLNDKDNYSDKMVKKANFYKNVISK